MPNSAWPVGLSVAGDALTSTNMNQHFTGVGAAASRSAQSVNSGVATKAGLTTEIADQFSWFDSATNFRFLPTTAGTYVISATAYGASLTIGTVLTVTIYKNGVATLLGSYAYVSANSDWVTSCCGVVALNGSTDYAEIYVSQNSGSAKNISVTAGFYRVGS